MRKKIISIILLVAMVLTMAAGCGKKEDKKDYFVFYVNNELTKVVAKKITLQHTSSGKAQVKNCSKICRHSRRMQRFEEPFHAK